MMNDHEEIRHLLRGIDSLLQSKDLEHTIERILTLNACLLPLLWKVYGEREIIKNQKYKVNKRGVKK